jgi:hypothetical protein
MKARVPKRKASAMGGVILSFQFSSKSRTSSSVKAAGFSRPT